MKKKFDVFEESLAVAFQDSPGTWYAWFTSVEVALEFGGFREKILLLF